MAAAPRRFMTVINLALGALLVLLLLYGTALVWL